MVAVFGLRHSRELRGQRAMTTIRYARTLFYYDGIQLFLATDPIGGHYVAMMIETPDNGHQYLVVGVAPAELRRFLSGELDLRSLMLQFGNSDWYTTQLPDDLEADLVIEREKSPLLRSGLLPEEGFVLHHSPSSETLIEEARKRHNLVFELVARPPESLLGHRIRVNTLSSMLTRVQTLVQHSYARALRKTSRGPKSKADVAQGYMMDVVVPAAAGSFRVLLEAAVMGDTTRDLFGHSELARALALVDELFRYVGDPDQCIGIVSANRGRVGNTYVNLLRFLAEQETDLRYSWAEPTSLRPHRGGVSKAEAVSLLDAFSQVSDISSEPMTVIGELNKFNRKSGIWGLRGEDQNYFGKIREGGPSLDGLKVGERYRFNCTEETEEVDVTGRQRQTLYLDSHEPA